MSEKFYITTAIDYVNGAPHMGHALEKIYTDAIARGHEMMGYEVRFQTGTDEHGTKIYRSAEKEGLPVQDFVNKNANTFEGLKNLLNLRIDDFIRTSDKERHYPAATKIWNKIMDAGYIEKRNYEGFYCSGCESFVSEKDLDENGMCPNHSTAPEKVEEENYFFKLSDFSDKVLSWLESREVAIEPEFRAKELINVVKDGLHDVSFSRSKSTLPWGVPVPDDPDQVMYVWCDALTNYISCLGYADESEEYKKWWPADVHVIGKDILRFHAAIWPAMLEAAGIPKPKKILVHGFVTSEGKKMSKSIGNVVDPVKVVNDWGADPLRWYLLSEMPFGQDVDFTWDRFKEKYSADLANNFGNLVSRVSHLAEKNLDSKLEGEVSSEVQNTFVAAKEKCEADLKKFDLHSYSLTVSEYFTFLNTETERLAPWKIAKEGTEEELKNALTSLAQGVYWGTALLYPLIPTTAEKIFTQFATEKPQTLESALENKIKTLKKGDILFPRKEE